MKNIKFEAHFASYRSAVEIGIYQKIGATGRMFNVAKPIEFTEVEVGLYVEPSLRLEPDEAQCLMDALWNCGLRPTEGSGSAGALLATQKHLEDMRTLVFKTIRKDE